MTMDLSTKCNVFHVLKVMLYKDNSHVKYEQPLMFIISLVVKSDSHLPLFQEKKRWSRLELLID